MTCLRFDRSIISNCRNNIAGVKTIYLANFDDIDLFVVDSSGVTMTTLMGFPAEVFYKLVQNKNVSAFLDTGQINLQNSISLSKTKITFKLQGLSADIIKIYQEMLQSTLVAIVKDMAGDYFCFGFNRGMECTESTIGTESNSDGFTGATFTLEANEKDPFYILDSTITPTFESIYVVQ